MKVPTMYNVFNLVIKVIAAIVTLLIIAVLVVGLYQAIYEIKNFLATKPVSQSFNVIVVNILTFLVIFELFRSFVIYIKIQRFRLSTIIDPAIIYVIRELIIKLYEKQNMSWQSFAILGFVLLCLGITRSLAVKYSPGYDSKESRDFGNPHHDREKHLTKL